MVRIHNFFSIWSFYALLHSHHHWPPGRTIHHFPWRRGGAVYVGVLTGLCNIPPDIAASTSLATVIPTAMMGAFSHYRAGNVHRHLALYLLAGCIPGAIVGSFFSTLLPLWIYNKMTGVILLVLALQMAWTCIRPPKHEVHSEADLTKKDKLKAGGFGIIGGLLCGLVGLSGGGPITAGLFILGCTPLAAVGTSVLSSAS